MNEARKAFERFENRGGGWLPVALLATAGVAITLSVVSLFASVPDIPADKLQRIYVVPDQADAAKRDPDLLNPQETSGIQTPDSTMTDDLVSPPTSPQE